MGRTLTAQADAPPTAARPTESSASSDDWTPLHGEVRRLEGREAYLGFMRPFVQILTGSEIIAAFGDEKTAVVVYDTATVPVASAPAAECVTVTDGKITYNRFIFDRAPFDAARRAAAGAS